MSEISSAKQKQTRFSIPWLSSKLFQLFFALHEENNDGVSTQTTQSQDTLGAFKDAMALQLSEGISEGLRHAMSAEPFFRRVVLPEFSCLRRSGIEDSSMMGSNRQMGVYAVPMFDDSVGVNKENARCWICSLVDQEIEGVWN